LAVAGDIHIHTSCGYLGIVVDEIFTALDYDDIVRGQVGIKIEYVMFVLATIDGGPMVKSEFPSKLTTIPAS
jgi:hypothetical protein